MTTTRSDQQSHQGTRRVPNPPKLGMPRGNRHGRFMAVLTLTLSVLVIATVAAAVALLVTR